MEMTPGHEATNCELERSGPGSLPGDQAPPQFFHDRGDFNLVVYLAKMVGVFDSREFYGVTRTRVTARLSHM